MTNRTRLLAFGFIAVVLLAAYAIATRVQTPATAPGAAASAGTGESAVSLPKAAKLGKIPLAARIAYFFEGHIYVIDENGLNETQITFGEPRQYEHVAVSFDRRYVIASEQQPNPSGEAGGHSRLWLFDLQKGVEVVLLPGFATAGSGGVAWDRNGFVYFSGKEQNLFPNPSKTEELIANAGANDVYRVKLDGTDLQRLTHTADRGEADVSISDDGSLIVYASFVINPPNDYQDIWVAGSDGSNARLVYKGGKPGVDAVYDPEISHDNGEVVFSKVNAQVPPNFANNPAANTAHDLFAINIDGTGLRRLTRPGPISIVPSIQGNSVVYFKASEKDNFIGAAVIALDGSDQAGKPIKAGASAPRWIP